MTHAARRHHLSAIQRTRTFCIACTAVLALGITGCNDSDTPPERVMPAGRLVQNALRGPISYISAEGWRLAIEGRAIVVKPPEARSHAFTQYVSQGMRDQLGTVNLRAWAGERRSLLLPGGVKVTLHGQGGQLMRLSIYEGAESHEVDVLTQTLMHSRVDAATARSRDAAEHDGETAQLLAMPGSSGSGEPPSWSLYLGNVYLQNADSNGVPLKEQAAPRPLGRQVVADVHPYADPGPTFASDAEATCDVTAQPRGRLARLPGSALEYTSRSGWWKFKVDHHQIILTRNIGATYQAKWEVWGDPHENLNGKHIKDWSGTRRTLLLDDGTKITLDSAGPQGVVLVTSIYDGAQSHEIGNADNAVRHSCVNAAATAQRDLAELDGDTAYLAILRSPASVAGSLFVEEIYAEVDESGTAVRKWDPLVLGETGEADINPTQVRDFYDDPRLGHT